MNPSHDRMIPSNIRAIAACDAEGFCNRLSSRVQRVLSSRPGLRDGWSSLSAAEKTDFFKQHHGACGAELAMLVNTSVKNSFTKTKTNNFTAASSWLDEVGLRVAMKGKPEEQIQNVRRNARRVEHPDEKVTLYEHISFTGTGSETTTADQRRDIAMSSEQTIKGQKRVKDDAEVKPKRVKAIQEPKPAKIHPLTGKGLEKVQATQAAMCELLADRQWEDLLAEYPDIPRIYEAKLPAPGNWGACIRCG